MSAETRLERSSDRAAQIIQMTRRRRARKRALFLCTCTVLSVALLGVSHATSVAAAGPPGVTPSPVLAWGSNFLGEAGNGGSGDQHSTDASYPYNDYPVPAEGLNDVIAISASQFSTAALVQGRTPDGAPDPTQNTVWTWGDDRSGQLGARPPDVCDEPNDHLYVELDPCAKLPVQVRGPGGTGYLTGIIAIADGGFHMLALRYDGTVWAWGDDEAGELGVAPPSAADPACPSYTNDNGVTETFDVYCQPYPVQVPGLTGVTSLAAGLFYSLAIEQRGGGADGTVWAWGDNSGGELGQGWDCGFVYPPTVGCDSPVPVQVPGLHDVSTLAAGARGQTMAIVRGQAVDGADNQLWTWGGDDGQGVSGVSQSPPPYANPPHDIDRPEQVLDASGTGYFTGAVAVSTSDSFSVALRYDARLGSTTVWSWGAAGAYSGPIGCGTPGGDNLPCQVRGPNGDGFLTGAVAVAATYESAHVLLTDGTVWGWGGDMRGELAREENGQTPPYSMFPVQARGVASATAIAAGAYYVLALAPLPPPAPPPVVRAENDTPPPLLPYEQPGTAAPIQPPQGAATVPGLNPGVAPSTVNPPPQPPASGTVSTQPVSTSVQAATPVHAPVQAPGAQAPAQGAQVVVGTAPIPGSPGAMAPSLGDRPTPTDQLAMLRDEDTLDTVWALGIAAAAAGALLLCVVASARSRRPPEVRSAPAWAGAPPCHADERKADGP